MYTHKYIPPFLSSSFLFYVLSFSFFLSFT
jgi:hypothetical protein